MTAPPVVGIMAVVAAWILFWMVWPTIGRTSPRDQRPHTLVRGEARRVVGTAAAAVGRHRRPDLRSLIPTVTTPPHPHEGGRAAGPESAPTATARAVGEVPGPAAPSVHSP